MKAIHQSPLFAGLSPNGIDQIVDQLGRTKHYRPEEVISLRGDLYQQLLIVVEGKVRGEMINPQGERTIIEEIEAPRAIAPAFLFASDNRLPVDVVAIQHCTLVSIPINDFTQLLQQDNRLLHNFLRIMSDRSQFLSDRVRQLRYGSLQNKLATYLVELMEAQHSRQFKLSHTQQALADRFGVARPSVARMLKQFVLDGIIESNNGQIVVVAPQRLSQLMNL